MNLIGLKRHDFPIATRQLLTTAFKLLYRSNLNVEDAVNRIETLQQIPEIVYLLEFCKSSKRGLAGTQFVRVEEDKKVGLKVALA